MTASSDKFLETLEKNLKDEMLKGKSKDEPKTPDKPEEPLFAGKEAEKAGGRKKFSKVYGFVPPSGIDHYITCYKASDWDEDVAAHIPDKKKFEHYQPQHHELELAVLGLEMNDNINIVGPTGSGKSSMIEYICALSNRPFVRINGRGDLESSGLLGQLTVEAGSTVWQDGAVTEAVRKGMTLCVDEWTLIPPEILMTLQYLMEDGGKLVVTDLPGSTKDKTITPHKDFRMVCTDNTRGLGDDTGAFAATNVQNTATLDRFGTVIHLGYLDMEHEKNVLKGACPSVTDAFAIKAIKFAALMRASYDKGDISLTCSPRTLLNWTRKAIYFQDAKLSLRMAFFEKIGSDAERQAISGFYRTVFNEDLI